MVEIRQGRDEVNVLSNRPSLTPWAAMGRRWYSLFCFCLLVKFLLFIADDAPRFLFGDSNSYLFTSWRGYLPNERSWTYGLLLNAIMRTSGSFEAILYVQSLVSAASIAFLGAVVAEVGKLRLGAYVLCALVLMDPLIIYYDRSILTDSLAVSFFIAFVLSFYKALYEDWGRWLFLVLSVFCVVATLSLRTAYAPAFIGLGIVCLLFFGFCWLGRPHILRECLPRSVTSAAAAVLVVPAGVALTMAINAFFNPSMGFSLNAQSGKLMMATLAPIIEYPMLGEAGITMSRETFDKLDIKDRHRRFHQIFRPDGLAATLGYDSPSWPSIEAKLRALCKIVLREKPGGVLALYAQQLLDQMNFASYQKPPENWLVNRAPFDADVLRYQVYPFVWQKLDQKLPTQLTTAERYLIWMRPWLWFNFVFALTVPIGIVLPLKKSKPLYLILSLSAAGYALSTVAFMIEVIPRYDIPLEPLNIAAVVLLIAAFYKRVERV